MKHTLLHLYGPISIHSYGLMIALGLLVFTYLIQRDYRFKKLHLEPVFTNILLVGVFAALFGGRFLDLASNPDRITSLLDIIAFWKPGFSILGSVIGCAITIPIYLKMIRVPIIPTFDLAAIYAPLLQAISRIGCFFAGCCYGLPTNAPWGITYTDAMSAAPLDMCIHPSQFYSSFLLLIIFLCMYFVAQKVCTKDGQLSAIYGLLISVERFVVDFYRGDRYEASVPGPFSFFQYVALALMGASLAGLVYFTLKKSDEHI